ncbi:MULTISPECIES: hypothetical protein [unclassified Comamonas]|uniref:hypothetical protein n=1 Tax=unclassified Comamonas TaxID=2638500 RepID=UPI0011DD2A7C|nr:hypothetical protein [Comamonas sp. B-9]
MSDDCELYFLERDTRPARAELDGNGSPYLLSEWHLPIVWLALFQPQDARIDLTSIRDGDRAYFATLRNEALSNLENRKAWIQAAVPNLDVEWLDSFTKFLTTCKLPWVHVQPLSFYEDGSAPSIEALKDLLKIFSCPPNLLGTASSQGLNLYSAHFASQFDQTEKNIKLISLGYSGTEDLAEWDD